MDLVKYNIKNPGIKRLMREAVELSEATEEYHAYPLEDNLFEWHFTVRGAAGSEFEGGVYHGRILLPSEYPMKPPDIVLLTPNGRFETNKKICLSISGHHPETWQPSWSIRTALLALIAFMPTNTTGAIGSLDYSPEERKTLARRSRDFRCAVCGDVNEKLSKRRDDRSTICSAEASLVHEIMALADNKDERVCSEDAVRKTLESQPAPEPQAQPLDTPQEVDNNEYNRNTTHAIPFIIFFMVTTIIVLLLRRVMAYKYTKLTSVIDTLESVNQVKAPAAEPTQEQVNQINLDPEEPEPPDYLE